MWYQFEVVCAWHTTLEIVREGKINKQKEEKNPTVLHSEVDGRQKHNALRPNAFQKENQHTKKK